MWWFTDYNYKLALFCVICFNFNSSLKTNKSLILLLHPKEGTKDTRRITFIGIPVDDPSERTESGRIVPTIQTDNPIIHSLLHPLALLDLFWAVRKYTVNKILKEQFHNSTRSLLRGLSNMILYLYLLRYGGSILLDCLLYS